MAHHEIPLERRTLHGHFSRDLAPVLTVDPGDSIGFSCLSSGWWDDDRNQFEPRDPELDGGHALVGPVEVRGARAGQTLEIAIDRVDIGRSGLTLGGGFSTPLNDRLGVSEEPVSELLWALKDGVGRDQHGREVRLDPFLGVIGMPPDEPGMHSTAPPRSCGGNIDCKELVPGTVLYLPIAVDGALLSAGDGHAAQGDGEISQLAIEAPVARAQLTVSLRDDLPLGNPIAWTPEAWITFGFDEDLDEAAALAIEGLLELMAREHGLDRRDALALASVAADLRVTQLVNGARGVHAVLAHDAFRSTRIGA